MIFKKIMFMIVSAMILFLASCSGQGQAAVKTGIQSPDFSLYDTNGNNHKLSSYRGSYVVLEWLNHDCPFVRKHYGSNNMQNLQKQYTDKGIIWLSISSSAEGKQGHFKPNAANKLTVEKGASPTAVLLDFDGKVGRMYGAKTTPHMFIINSEGTLVYQGAIDSIPSANPNDVTKAQNYVQLALDEVLSGKSITIPQTKSYGCSVKY